MISIDSIIKLLGVFQYKPAWATKKYIVFTAQGKPTWKVSYSKQENIMKCRNCKNDTFRFYEETKIKDTWIVCAKCSEPMAWILEGLTVSAVEQFLKLSHKKLF